MMILTVAIESTFRYFCGTLKTILMLKWHKFRKLTKKTTVKRYIFGVPITPQPFIFKVNYIRPAPLPVLAITLPTYPLPHSKAFAPSIIEVQFFHGISPYFQYSTSIENMLLPAHFTSSSASKARSKCGMIARKFQYPSK
jgi:hypothetical protein